MPRPKGRRPEERNEAGGEPQALPELLQAQDLRVTFRVGGRALHAVDGVSLSVGRGQTVALVGESGSGKSTVALTLMREHEPEAGRILFDGTDITHTAQRALKPVRRRMQMIFQDPYSSLDPRMSVRRIIAEPLRAHGIGERRKIAAQVAGLLEDVGLPPDAADRLPSQFSGGQRQRIAIARALALEPDLLVADEPVSALDVSIQAQIVNLLADIQRDRGISYLVISHDLALVHHIADVVAVMYLGRIVEQGEARAVVAAPRHPYTAALISAAAPLPRERVVLRGDPPSPINRPTGCAFHPRCPAAQARCAVESPPLVQVAPGASVACFYPLEGRMEEQVEAPA